MKKFKPFLLVLATMFLLQNALFAVDYDLYVGGVRVTDANKDNVTGSTILSGTVSYDPTSKTLTLNNAAINTIYSVSSELRGITNNDIAGLTINLIGTNTITVPEDIFRFNKSTTISGDGSLHCIGGDDAITLDQNVHIRISNTTLSIEIGSNANGDADVFYCYRTDTVTITNSTFRVQGQSRFNDASIKLNLSGCDFVEPAGAYYDGDNLYNSDYATLVGSSPIAIAPVYPLWVADVQVHALNLDSIAGPSITGLVTYDTATLTLTLNNATLAPQYSEEGLFNEGIENLTIELVGQNTIAEVVDDGIRTEEVLTITGDGSLDITAPYGIHFYGELSFFNTQIAIHCSDAAFFTGPISYDVLNITNSTVSIGGQEKFSYGVDTLILTSCAIVEPVCAFFYDTQIRDSLGNIVVDPILIAPVQPDPIEPGDTTSIYDVAANLSVQLYPNPATTLLNVVAEGFDYVEILNFVGQRLYRAPLTDGTTQLNVATLPAGTYFLRLQGDSVAVKKFTKN